MLVKVVQADPELPCNRRRHGQTRFRLAAEYLYHVVAGQAELAGQLGPVRGLDLLSNAHDHIVGGMVGTMQGDRMGTGSEFHFLFDNM